MEKIVSALDLDFSKYDYVGTAVSFYRVRGGKADYFDEKELKWKPSKSDIVQRMANPFDDVDLWEESQKDELIKAVVESVNYETSN